MPSPLVPTGILRAPFSMPLVSVKNGLLLMPPAFALSLGSSANIGIKKLAMDSASVLLK